MSTLIEDIPIVPSESQFVVSDGTNFMVNVGDRVACPGGTKSMSSDDNRPRSDPADRGLCPKCGGGMVLIRRTQYPDTDHDAETLACHKCGELVTRFSTKRGKKAKNRAVPRHTGL